jgi:hypothetical protein
MSARTAGECGPLAFSVSQIHWLVMIFKISILLRLRLKKREKAVPKMNVLTRALICPFFDLYPTYHPTGHSGAEVACRS